MNIAQEIKKAVGNDLNAAIEAAEKLEHEVDQDWDNEKTTFTFTDGSQLACTFDEIEALSLTERVMSQPDPGLSQSDWSQVDE